MKINNLTCWAVTQGYDPAVDYTSSQPLPDGYLSLHFRAAEFACNHCGNMHPDPHMPPKELLDILEDVRAHFGQPVVVNSGYRCVTHNTNVGGATNSQHLRGTAADIMVKDTLASEVFNYLDPTHEGGLGRYSTFTHIDVRGSKARWYG